MPVEDEIAVIYCGVNGLLENVPIDKVAEFEKQFLQLMHAKYPEDMAALAKGALSDDTADKLKLAAADVAARFRG